MADLVTLTTRLTEAQAAYHKLMTGSQIASVNIDGEGQVSYSKADTSRLENYISALTSQISVLNGDAINTRAPIRITF